ncbi:ATP-binding cassette domain-containing protein [Gordonia pseudamarae]|uniref:ATP-binding cassette domain-containing protein n=1 Tax=Gordonia pseudamarae TaxID=2831662 RepID=A0ABX6ID14_9ACTN|nr:MULTISPECIES: ATP-binding cassette domain-containing protein [Gordonia]MBD0022009.1 ATP-binding cassette domain-containing protein [Gordonia sp. (in: high G+C Gram-positive bacteria)]QHN24870.1 ATP-binding cassette domain-containing protein [Gordonia pseudamarae]QHN33803.1 ATP-binding cassette domain-containing protein [Gordonia pseudamarae]
MTGALSPGIEIDRVSIRLAGREIVREASLRVAGGEVTYLLGRNGAGKSTLLRAIAGIVPVSAGTISVNGAALARAPRPLAQIGTHLHPDGFHSGHTGVRHLRWLATASGINPARVGAVLEAVGLTSAADRPVTGYSLGMRQRLGIAGALLGDAPTLILDEPLNGLDIMGIRWMRGLLADLAADGRSVLVASHLFDEVRRSGHRVAVVDGGRIVADAGVDEFIDGHASLEDAYLSTIGEIR